MYSNLDGSGKLNFYKNYFGVDPAEQPEAVWSILNYYVYGLKFVFQYYFKKLASWSWYYPHYFAPLLTDIQYFIGCILAQDSKLTKFAEDSPFEPFKQLLCILPKESADLLPPNFNWLLNTPESPLRTPVDYYPDHIQSIPYGSTRAHEAISLIPYLDQATVLIIISRSIRPTINKQKKLHKQTLKEISCISQGYMNITLITNLAMQSPLFLLSINSNQKLISQKSISSTNSNGKPQTSNKLLRQDSKNC